MVVQVAPVEKNVAETVCSLNFAQRVRTVELGQATKRTIKSWGMEYAFEMIYLFTWLVSVNSSSSGTSNAPS